MPEKKLKLFVSYRRAAWSFTYWLVEELRKVLDAEIFVDYSGIDETSFESSLIRNLGESAAVLLIVDEHTFAQDRIHKDSDWVRREIRAALEADKPIILACHNGLFPPRDLPQDIQAIRGKQGIEFYPRFFKAGVNELVSFIARATPIRLLDSSALVTPPSIATPGGLADRSDRTRFHEATTLAEAGQYDAALTLLVQLRESGYRLRFGSLDDVIIDITTARNAEQSRWEAGEAYDEIAALMRVNLDRARRAWVEFQQEYPEFMDDPAELANKLKSSTGVSAEATLRLAPMLSTVSIMSPPFAWWEIPAGKVALVDTDNDAYFGKKGKTKTFDVSAFAIAKYPITNAQYAQFVEAGGYSNQKWWSREGWKTKRTQNWSQPRFWGISHYEPFNRPNHPVVGVSWYEAVAFCLWLSEIAGENIMLPTEQMWQRAAQGDDRLTYPWGNYWDGARCNNNVDSKGVGTTTPVTQYEGRNKGDSPFGVTDMAGNVWEWCLTDYENGNNLLSIGAKSRVVRGGAWKYPITDLFRATCRNRSNPDEANNSVGFRCTCSR